MKNLNIYLSVLFLYFVLCTSAQIKVTSSGTVGIGTNNPKAKLHIIGNSVFTQNSQTINSAAYIRGNNSFSTAITPDFSWYNNDQTGIFHPASNVIALSISGSEKMRIDNRGYIGINNTSPSYRLDLQGTMRFNNWTDVYFTWTGDYGSALIYPERDYYFQLGKNTKRIGKSYHHAVYTYNLYEDGASENKNELSNIEEPISKLMSVNGVQYYLDESVYNNLPEYMKQYYKQERYGLKIDEIEEVFPQLIFEDDSSGIKYINYTRFVPVLIEALKSQQQQIEYLNSVIKGLPPDKSVVIDDVNQSESSKEQYVNKPILYQNTPNPFNEKTIIKFYIPSYSNHSSIYIFDMGGSLIKSIALEQEGNGSIIIDAFILQPGMYIYSLVVDNKEIDSKRMIMTK